MSDKDVELRELILDLTKLLYNLKDELDMSTWAKVEIIRLDEKAEKLFEKTQVIK